MTSLFRRLTAPREERSALSFDDYLNYFTFNGIGYQLGGQLDDDDGRARAEEIGSDFQGSCRALTRRTGSCSRVSQHGSSCPARRVSSSRFQRGRPGDLYSTPALQMLETPSPGQYTSDRWVARSLMPILPATGMRPPRGRGCADAAGLGDDRFGVESSGRIRRRPCLTRE